MIKKVNKLAPGLYVIIDPSMDMALLKKKLSEVLSKNISAIQILDHFRKNQDPESFINKVHHICADSNVPVLINNAWKYLIKTKVEGVHFDFIPENLHLLKTAVSRNIITGITCGNDLNTVKWAAANGVDYISFCSLFPSVSASTCEIVDFEIIKKARKIFQGLLFLAGGIYAHNLALLNELQYDGIAVISGIMNTENPSQAIDQYNQKLKLTL